MTAQRIDEVVMHYKHGTSHKEYRLWLERAGSGNGWHVGFGFGRIGRGLREGYKTTAPVTCGVAQEIKDRIWDEKLRKGYVDVMTQGTARTARATQAMETDVVSRMAMSLPVNRNGRCVIVF